MPQVWLCVCVCVSALNVAAGRPADPGDPGDAQIPYRYEYSVDVPETGDFKSHFEARDPNGVVVGSFQVLDPSGDLRKLSYRVEGNSGFVITDMQVMRGFRPPPPDPSTYTSRRRLTTGADVSTLAQGRPGAVVGPSEVGRNRAAAAESAAVDGDVGAAVGDAVIGGASGANGATGAGGDRDGTSGVSTGGSAVGAAGPDAAAGGGGGGGGRIEEPSDSAAGTVGSGGVSGDQRPVDGGDASGQQSARGSPPSREKLPVSSPPPDISFTAPAERVRGAAPAFTFNIVRKEANVFDVQGEITGHRIKFTAWGPGAPAAAAATATAGSTAAA